MTGRSIPIPTLHLFPVLDELLIGLLISLSPEDWNKPTLARLWSVKDVAAHLLDTNMRTVSADEGYSQSAPLPIINNYADLVNYLNELNADWIKAMKRVSPLQLTDMLKRSGKQYIACLSSRDPFAASRYPVSWAGEEQSENWFDIAREYTEKWHHQQQIREAVGKTAPLMTRELFYPCMDTFMCGLPHAYRDVKAEINTIIKITISTKAGGDWYLVKKQARWCLDKKPYSEVPVASVSISPDTAWKLFTKAIGPDAAIQTAEIKGEFPLAKNVFSMIAVMA